MKDNVIQSSIYSIKTIKNLSGQIINLAYILT